MPIKGRPILEYWLFTLHDVVPLPIFINTHYLHEHVDQFLSRPLLSNFCKISQEKKLLGTAGTLRNLYSELKDKSLLVVHSDNWSSIQIKRFIEFHKETRSLGHSISMVTFEAEFPEKCGVVTCDEKNVVTGFHEKIKNPPGNTANAAIFLMEPNVLDWILRNPKVKDLSLDLVPKFLGDIRCFHHNGFHRDIGTIDQLIQAQFDDSKSITWKLDDWLENFRKSETVLQVKRLSNVARS